jgi:lipid A 4'-phosphatase
MTAWAPSSFETVASVAVGEAARDMHYLKFRRSRIILLAFACFTIVVMAFPAIDIGISRLFFHDGFPRDQGWQRFMHDVLNWFLCLSIGGVAAIYSWNRLRKQDVLEIDGRRVAYLFLVLIIGGGLIVNVTLKDNFGRARPRDIVEFGGTKQFTPAFVVSRECNTNCSFSSGDAAGGFFSIALALALTRRRAAFAAALAVGTFVSLGRISSGAHFFSDTVVSFFVMLLVADALYYYVVLSNADRDEARALGTAFKPALVAVVAEPVVKPE